MADSRKTTIYLPQELKERLVERARQANFKVGAGRDSELPQFIASLLRDEPAAPMITGDTPAAAWESFYQAVSPWALALSDKLGDLGIKCDVFASDKSLLVAEQASVEATPQRKHLFGEQTEGWTAGDFAALGRLVKDLLVRLFDQTEPNRLSPWFASLQEADWFLHLLDDAIRSLEGSKRTRDSIKYQLAEHSDYMGYFPQVDVESLADRLLPDGLALQQTRDKAKYVARTQFVLKLDPHNADAQLLLIDLLGVKGEDKIRACEQALRAAEQRLRPGILEKADRYGWSVEYRPYMRARAALALAYWEAGQFEPAVAHYQALLRLNPNDNQGNRYQLMSCLLEWAATHPPALAQLGSFLAEQRPSADQIADDWWAYTYAGYLFLTEGDSRKANNALRQAFKQNRHVPSIFLLEIEGLIAYADQLMGASQGSEEEAIFYYVGCYRAWAKQPEALRWLRQKANRSEVLGQHQPRLYADPPRQVTKELLNGFGPLASPVPASAPDAYPALTLQPATDIELIARHVRQMTALFSKPEPSQVLAYEQPVIPAKRIYLLDKDNQLLAIVAAPPMIPKMDDLVTHLLVSQALDKKRLPVQWYTLEGDRIAHAGRSWGIVKSFNDLIPGLKLRPEPQNVSRINFVPHLIARHRDRDGPHGTHTGLLAAVDFLIIADWQAQQFGRGGAVQIDAPQGDRSLIEDFQHPPRIHVVSQGKDLLMTLYPNSLNGVVNPILDLLAAHQAIPLPLEIFLLEDAQVKQAWVIIRTEANEVMIQEIGAKA